MQFSTVLLAGFAALASAQTFTGSTVSPTAAAPSGCATTYPGSFALSVVNVTAAKTSKAKRATSDSQLVISLKGSVLSDSQGRIGYIASNYQFQFDAGGQAGQLYTAGFSVCSNNTLALGGSAIFYQCLSGTFYNLYDRNWAPQCQAIYLEIIPTSSTAAISSTTVAGAANTVATGASAVTSTVAGVSSISDGQAQGATKASAVTSSVSVVTSVKASTTSAAIISSISDHQIQAPTSSSAVVATSSVAIVSSISDHQIQAPTSASAVLSTKSLAIVSSISDHQIQAPTSTSVQIYTGAAAMPTMAAQVVLAVAGAAIALL